LLGLYATFIFQKPDPDLEPPLTTPIITLEGSNNHDEREMSVNTDTSAPAEDSSQGLGKISEQKGILGPGPADLRFSEAI
jgi:mRNA (guanine-N7-)-methyltransferase